MSEFIKEVKHTAKPPVRIEREEGDVINIEGTRYDGDYFRFMGAPDADVLYAVRKLDDGCVCLTVVNNEEQALQFFQEIASG